MYKKFLWTIIFIGTFCCAQAGEKKNFWNDPQALIASVMITYDELNKEKLRAATEFRIFTNPAWKKQAAYRAMLYTKFIKYHLQNTHIEEFKETLAKLNYTEHLCLKNACKFYYQNLQQYYKESWDMHNIMTDLNAYLFSQQHEKEQHRKSMLVAFKKLKDLIKDKGYVQLK